MNESTHKRRVMWLMNHGTLRAFEVPLLVSMGYEVFLPKSFPYDEGNLSASVDYGFDKTLTIPGPELEILNRHDFYGHLTPEVAQIVNSYFDHAIVGFFPNQLDGLVRDFKGSIVMRPFGLATGVTYTDVIAATMGQGFFSRLKQVNERFWFGQAYANLAEIEADILARKAIHLPLGLAESERPAWTGSLAKIFFVCPRIKTTTYFDHIYRDFKDSFGDLPHMIGGVQPISVEDPNVIGFQSRDKYDDIFRDARLMFYHSRERYHLHYHPLEAIQAGLPLIFMSGGMLDQLGGTNLPGRAVTIAEARKKIGRILKGDRRLIDKIRNSQRKILQSFSAEHCRSVWNTNFSKIATAGSAARRRAEVEVRRRPRVAVILNEAYRGGTLEVAKLATKMLNKGAAQAGEPCEFVFYHPPSHLYTPQDFADLADEGIPRRVFDWKILGWQAAREALSLGGWLGPIPRGADFAVPTDGADSLSSFSHWIFSTDRFRKPVLPLRPYTIYVQDFLQRYIPSLYGNHYEYEIIESLRAAEQLLCTTDHVATDATQYAGVSPGKVRLVPLVAEFGDALFEVKESKPAGEYFIWATNIQYHKNHLRAIDALSKYYSTGGRLRCLIIGVDTKLVDPKADKPELNWEYLHNVRRAFEQSTLVGRHIEILGEVSRSRYWSLLRNASFVFHPTLSDNGTLVAAEAASLGVPVLSHDYPPMRYYQRRFGIPVSFVNARDIELLASALTEMESDASDIRLQMPSRAELERFRWQNQAGAFWAATRHGIT